MTPDLKALLAKLKLIIEVDLQSLRLTLRTKEVREDIDYYETLLHEINETLESLEAWPLALPINEQKGPQ